MADSKSDLAAAVEEMFPGHPVERKKSVGEKQRRLTIKTEKDDEVVLARLAAGLADKGERTADAVFVCRSKNPQRLLVLVVELKGSDFPHALTQIEQTAERYCRKATGKPHGKNIQPSHGGKVVGLVSCRQAQKDQNKIRLLRKKGIIAIHVKDYEITLSELYKRAG